MSQWMRRALAALVWAAAVGGPAMASGSRVMIVTWRGCEEACQGVQQELAASGQVTEVIVRDANRSEARAREALAAAREAKMDLVVTWGTNVSVAVAGRLTDRGGRAFTEDMPIVFMIVADPIAAELVESLERPGRRNVTGTFNRVPEEVNIDTIRSYRPDFRHLGLLFNSNEANSVIKRDEMAALARRMDFRFTALELPLQANGRPRPEDIGPLMERLGEAGVDFVYVGSSSFLRANSAAMARAARQTRLPLLSPYEEMVREGGALISVGARYQDVGRLAAQQALRLLAGPVPAAGLPIAAMTEFAVVINLETARAIGQFPPVDLLQIAETVN